jgi:DNA-binding GntR family transcriptional regulator
VTGDHGRATSPGADARQVRDTVRRWILNRQLRPGELLLEHDIALRIDAPGDEVRDALRELAEEGMVVLLPSQGALVANPAPDELAEADEVRRGLEEVAVRRFIARASEDELRALHRAVRRFRWVAENDPRPDALLQARDWIYHLLLRVGAGVTTAIMLQNLRHRVGLVLYAGLTEPSRAREAAEELESICRAIAARDPEAAAAACERHLRRSTEAGLRLLAAPP